MREILFRGKRKDNGEWVEGYYVCVGGKFHYILTGQIDLMSGYPRFIYCEVIPETVCQYTGFTDKNGKKIFEGDIVKYGDTIHEVVFEKRNNTAYFGLVYNELETLPFGHYQDLKQIEIIGNIHDNHELVEGGAEQ